MSAQFICFVLIPEHHRQLFKTTTHLSVGKMYFLKKKKKKENRRKLCKETHKNMPGFKKVEAKGAEKRLKCQQSWRTEHSPPAPEDGGKEYKMKQRRG